MADGSLVKQVSLKGQVSDAEWQARVSLAALYRVVAMRGWDDLIYTHISARIPGPEHHFLINPYGLFFSEITASSLVKVDTEGNMLQETEYAINPAGFTIHSAIHMARDDAMFVMHLHTDNGIAVSAQKEGLLPISQHALVIMDQVTYHDYEGIALDLDERERLVADLGSKNLMILRNHGTLAVGDSPGQCWGSMYYLEKSCAHQIGALSAGRDNILLAPAEAQAVVSMQVAGVSLTRDLAWPACLREIDRVLPGYDV